MKIRILYGGSFDPPHNGHLFFAKYIIEILNPDEFIFLPATQSPLKKHKSVASSEDRGKMTAIAIRKLGITARLSTYDMDRPAPSYSIDTLKHFYDTDTNLFWVIGEDQLLQLHKWHDYPAHLDYCNFIVLPRESNIENLKKICKIHPAADHLIPVNSMTVPISSSEIRKMISRGEKPEHMIPDCVHNYIMKNGLYQ